MRMGGILFLAAALCVSLGCGKSKTEPSGPLGLTRDDVGIPKEHAEKVLKVLESANAHNDRLKRMDEQLFAEDAR